MEIIKTFEDGARLTKVKFVWPCFNCTKPFEVDFKTFNLLETKMLLGIKCPDCILPPPESGIVRSAA